jgi:signal transduction histidine kinase
MLFRGEFIAAWHRLDGRWVVVGPEPDFEWIRRISLWFFGGGVLVGPVGYWFARRISAPLKGFAASADALGRDPQAAMLAPTGPAEIGVAARAFNAMQARLQRFVSDRIGMVGAISHDLRTPLTRIRFRMEQADSTLRRAVLRDVRQMEHMIKSLIDFSQDLSAAPVRKRLDLSSLVVSVADDAAQAGENVQAPFDRPVVINGDPVALQRLFNNLIDNAVKYGKCARISVFERDGQAVVTVADDGPGLDEAELGRVFTPFYRAKIDQHGAKPGVGLGLAIARAVALGHGGEIILRSETTGLVAEVILPLARKVALSERGAY